MFDEDGKFLDMFTTGVRSSPYAHLITTDQMLWVADGGTMRILKYDLNGKYLYGWGGLGWTTRTVQRAALSSPSIRTATCITAEVFGGRVQKFRPKPNADKSEARWSGAAVPDFLGTRDQGLGIRDQGPGIRDQGSGTRDRGVRHQGSG